MEVKCPFTPLTTPTLLPVSYKLPHYNACQVLTHMKAIGCKCLLFASCSLESLSVSLVDFEDSTWGRMFNFAKEMFADPEVMKPLEIQPKSINIKDEVKKFAESNSLLVAEVPTLVTFDDESLSTSPMPQENNKMYRHRKKLRTSTCDWTNINEFIVDLCERNITLLEKANDSLQRKASELLLFVACDSDREFQKDVPSCIPIAYGLKGKSIHLETARKMIDVVLNNLHEKVVNVLAQSLDGQLAQIVFRDSFNNPLTLYEFNKDCWSRFAKLGKKNLLRYMESFSHINYKNIEGLSKPE